MFPAATFLLVISSFTEEKWFDCQVWGLHVTEALICASKLPPNKFSAIYISGVPGSSCFSIPTPALHSLTYLIIVNSMDQKYHMKEVL